MNAYLLNECLKTAAAAARLAGDIIVKNLGRLSGSDIQTKQAFDFVTNVDRWSEAVIIKTIREKFPSHLFLTEETLQQEGPATSYRWIIDPLDGTTNFIHGFPIFSVSLGLEHKGEIILGVVFDPLRDELFHAIKGKGAFLNNARIKVSETGMLEKSLIATGFPFRKKELIDQYLRAFKKIFAHVSDIRRAGSAAIDLAYIAAGRTEGFFELNLSPWDIAAGSLLISEAGGVITDFAGGGQYLLTGNVVAGNREVHAELFSVIRQVFQGVVER
ncbi:MAG: inositol monophosphatase [Nitrospirota bacterium]|nr:inositol monophosphatase [Nitrospirota bacterium]